MNTNTNRTLTDRDYSIDALKIIACIGVICIHTAFPYIQTFQHSGYWYVATVIRTFFVISVPIFFMASGMFLLKKQESNKDFFKKRFSRVLIPFFAWGIFYMIFRFKMYEEPVFQIITAIPYNLFFHLWFVYVLLGLYLITPFLRAYYFGDRKICKKEVIAFFVLVIAFYFYKNFFTTENSRISLPVSNALVYYLAGHYLTSIKVNKEKLHIPVICGLICVVCVLLGGTVFLSLHSKKYVLFGGSFSTFLLVIFIFLLVQFHREYINNVLNKCSKIVSKCSALTFGVYLCHVLVYRLLEYCWLQHNYSHFYGATMTFIALTLLTTGISFSLCYILSLIPGIRKIFL